MLRRVFDIFRKYQSMDPRGTLSEICQHSLQANNRFYFLVSMAPTIPVAYEDWQSLWEISFSSCTHSSNIQSRAYYNLHLNQQSVALRNRGLTSKTKIFGVEKKAFFATVRTKRTKKYPLFLSSFSCIFWWVFLLTFDGETLAIFRS